MLYGIPKGLVRSTFLAGKLYSNANQFCYPLKFNEAIVNPYQALIKPYIHINDKLGLEWPYKVYNRYF